MSGEVAQRTALLAAWLDAGFDLGNHTYSHVSIDRVPFDAYKANLIRGETVSQGLLEARGRRLRYFPHPQLRTGPDAEYKAALDRLLAERGYRVAPVTIDNVDFVFADAYRRARIRNDRRTADRVGRRTCRTWSQSSRTSSSCRSSCSGGRFRRCCSFRPTSSTLTVFPSCCTCFVRGSLDAALEHPAYGLPEGEHARGLSSLHRWMLARGLPMQPEPTEPSFVRELFNSAQQ